MSTYRATHRSEILTGEDEWIWQCLACYEGGTEATEQEARRAAADHRADPGVDDEDLIAVGLLAEEGEDDWDDEDDLEEDDY